MKKMIAKVKFKYGTRALVPGDEFDCQRQDVRVLLDTGMAREKPEEQPARAPQINGAGARRPRSTYRRRDMRAEH